MREQDGYLLPEELARHAREGGLAPEELRGVCRSAGEGLGREDARAAMAVPEIVIGIALGSGRHAATVWTCDLSYDYVRINAEYRS